MTETSPVQFENAQPVGTFRQYLITSIRIVDSIAFGVAPDVGSASIADVMMVSRSLLDSRQTIQHHLNHRFITHRGIDH